MQVEVNNTRVCLHKGQQAFYLLRNFGHMLLEILDKVLLLLLLMQNALPQYEVWQHYSNTNISQTKL